MAWELKERDRTGERGDSQPPSQSTHTTPTGWCFPQTPLSWEGHFHTTTNTHRVPEARSGLAGGLEGKGPRSGEGHTGTGVPKRKAVGIPRWEQLGQKKNPSRSVPLHHYSPSCPCTPRSCGNPRANPHVPWRQQRKHETGISWYLPSKELRAEVGGGSGPFIFDFCKVISSLAALSSSYSNSLGDCSSPQPPDS